MPSLPKKTDPGISMGTNSGAVVTPIDPTANVLLLVEAHTKRQDDLRSKDREISDIQHKHQTDTATLRALHESTVGIMRENHQEKIAHAESGRIDSIRQVDREEVAKTAAAANIAIATLAKQTNDLAVTLAKTVADTAAAAESRNSAQYSDTNKRLSALELSSSEGKGKQTVADPQMEQLRELVATMARNQATSTGQSQGMSDSAKILVGVLALISTLLGFYTFSQKQPQAVYVPAPITVAPPLVK